MIDPERYRRAKDAFLAVCDAPADEREAVLDSACDRDPHLRAIVVEMLREDTRDSSILEPKPARPPTAPMIGRRVGRDRDDGRGQVSS